MTGHHQPHLHNHHHLSLVNILNTIIIIMAEAGLVTLTFVGSPPASVLLGSLFMIPFYLFTFPWTSICIYLTLHFLPHSNKTEHFYFPMPFFSSHFIFELTVYWKRGIPREMNEKKRMFEAIELKLTPGLCLSRESSEPYPPYPLFQDPPFILYTFIHPPFIQNWIHCRRIRCSQ